MVKEIFYATFENVKVYVFATIKYVPQMEDILDFAFNQCLKEHLIIKLSEIVVKMRTITARTKVRICY